MSHPFVKPNTYNGVNTRPKTQVTPKAQRRTFTAKYKLRILEEADQCTELGQIGALLRREGLYSSNLTTWRRQREKGQIGALSPKKRGPKPDPDAALLRENERLRKQNQRYVSTTLRHFLLRNQTRIQVYCWIRTVGLWKYGQPLPCHRTYPC